jgi:hypothetical protein
MHLGPGFQSFHVADPTKVAGIAFIPATHQLGSDIVSQHNIVATQERAIRPDQRDLRACHIAVACTGLGDPESAPAWLERGMANGETICIDVERDGFCRHLRSDSRFETLKDQCRAADVSHAGSQ